MTHVPRSYGRARTMLLVVVIALALTALGIWIVAMPSEPKPLPVAKEPQLPDLVMSPIRGVFGTVGGDPLEPLLAFDASIANIGSGDFIVSAHRSWPWSDDWVVTQRIPEASGGFTERSTPIGMVYGGDQHDHWHVRAVEAHRLERIDTGEVVAQVTKLGFCFFDVAALRPDLPGAPAQARWMETACDGRASTRLTLGLSVGWEDVYPGDMREQQIPLTGIPDGLYRLHEIADPDNVFQELDETNNETWVDVQIVTPASGFPRVTVVGSGPTP